MLLFLCLCSLLTLISLRQVNHAGNDAANDAVSDDKLRQMYNAPLPSWQSSTIVPSWLKAYATFHQEQTKLLNEANWNAPTTKYLIMRCSTVDHECGGASDRLQSIPVKLRLAAETNRLLFIHWERPARLQEFLVPPRNALLNWTLPDWLLVQMQPLFDQTFIISHTGLPEVRESCLSNQTVVETTSHFGENSGAEWYDLQLNRTEGEANFATVFHDVWKLLFQPTAPVQALIEYQMNELQLQPMQYHAIHIRSMFMMNEFDNTNMIENATNCALNSFGSRTLPLYVAADSIPAKAKAVQYAKQFTNHVVARMDDDSSKTTSTKKKSPATLHLDRGSNFLSPDSNRQATPPEAYYDTFVDVYVLSLARCVTYGRGSYGRWSSFMSANSSCSFRYFANRAYLFPQPLCDRPSPAAAALQKRIMTK